MNGVVSWTSQKQKVIALLSTEAELSAACETTKDVIWLLFLFLLLSINNNNNNNNNNNCNNNHNNNNNNFNNNYIII